MKKIFISYRRSDSSYVASAIDKELVARFGKDAVFFDIDAIPLGADFRKHIAKSVGQCDVLLAVIGNAWVNAVDDEGKRRLDNPVDSVRLEIEFALKREIPVIPVLVDDARIPAATELPDVLQGLSFRNGAEVRAGHDLQQHLARLIRGVERIIQPGQQGGQALSGDLNEPAPRVREKGTLNDPDETKKVGESDGGDTRVSTDDVKKPISTSPSRRERTVAAVFGAVIGFFIGAGSMGLFFRWDISDILISGSICGVAGAISGAISGNRRQSIVFILLGAASGAIIYYLLVVQIGDLSVRMMIVRAMFFGAPLGAIAGAVAELIYSRIRGRA